MTSRKGHGAKVDNFMTTRTNNHEVKRKGLQEGEFYVSEDDEDDEEEEMVSNKFANDGSFMEMFKKMQQQQQSLSKESSAAHQTKTSIASPNKASNETSSNKESNIGGNSALNGSKGTLEPKRKPKVLKVGVIKKQRQAEEDEVEDGGGNESAWNRYMKEVRMYKEKYGDDEDKNRPLVK